MCRGDRFGCRRARTCSRIRSRAGLTRLVFVERGSPAYLADGGRTLRDHAGKTHALGREEIRVAHPDDLLKRGDCPPGSASATGPSACAVQAGVPELYPMTETERALGVTPHAGTRSSAPRRSRCSEDADGSRIRQGVSARSTTRGSLSTHVRGAVLHAGGHRRLTLEEVVFTKKGEWNGSA